MLCFVLQRTPTNENNGGTEWWGIQQLLIFVTRQHCIGEVYEIYERYCFNMRDKLPTESADSFVAELRNLAKTCNFCDCLRDSLIRDRIVLVFNSKHNTRRYQSMKSNH